MAAKKEAKEQADAEKEEKAKHSHKGNKEETEHKGSKVEKEAQTHKHENEKEEHGKSHAASYAGHHTSHSKQTQHYEWVEYKSKDLEEVIINLANAGSTPSEIGMVLRDQYGIPNIAKVSGEKLEKILEKHKLLGDVPRDLLNLIKKSVQLENHLQKNKKDFTAKRGYLITVSKIRKLVNYYHKSGKLSKDWRYTPERAALLIK